MTSYNTYDKLSYDSHGGVSPSYLPFLDVFIVSAINGGGSVIDVGAGRGSHAEYMRNKGCDVTALDPSPHSMSDFKTKKQKIFNYFTMTSVSGLQVSALHAKDVVSDHIEEVDFIEVASSIIKPLGILMICHHIGHRPDRLAKIADESGFTLTSSTRWLPERGFYDWYLGDPASRNILMFQKKS